MKKIIYISILLLGGLTISNAQKTQVKEQTKNITIPKLYRCHRNLRKSSQQEVINPVDMLEKLGNSYYFNAEYVDAAKWYAELIRTSTRNYRC